MRFATLQDHLGVDKTDGIARAAALGFDGLELVIPDGIHDVGPHGMDLVADHAPVESDPVLSATGRTALRRQARDDGITFPSLCPSFLNFRTGLVASEATERAAVVDRLRTLIDAAAALDVETILLPFFRAAEIETAEDETRVAGALADLAPDAAAADVRLAIETSIDAERTRDLVTTVNHPAIGVYYDVDNAVAFGFDPAVEIRTLDEHIQQIHFKDADADGEHAMLGDGRVDFGDVAGAIEDIGYDDWIVLETSYERDPVATMAENLAYTKDLLQRA